MVAEIKGPDLFGAGREQHYDADGSREKGNYIKCGPFRALQDSLHVGLALSEVQLGP